MNQEELLFTVLSDFARTLATGLPVQRILEHLVARVVEVLPVPAAGATLICASTARSHVAATDEAALSFERLQSRTGDGPRVLAHESGTAVAAPDLAVDDRFARFGPAARSAGLASVHSFPLRHGAARIGALDLYSDVPVRLDRHSMDTAQMLADVTVAYLLNAQAGEEGRRAAERSRQSRLFDPLIGLPNRVLLSKRLERVARRADTSGESTAILFVNLDHFSRVNHTYGHQVGDELLRAVARRLSAVVRTGDTLARVSGDEFVFLCEDMHGETDVDELAGRVHHALEKPFVVGGSEIGITASVGVALAGPDDEISERLVITADTAMRQAKRKGGDSYQFIDAPEALETRNRHTLEADLRQAFAAGELDVVYQPIVRCADGAITGVEALLRWTDAERGPVSPEAIVAVAEQSGLISDIGTWVLERSCRDRSEWLRQHPGQPLDLAVNISARQLMNPDFSGTVAGALARTGMAPTALILEMTEHILIEDLDRALLVLADLKDLGIRLALDDFGTGYSSLSYLQRLPIDIVKIDQSFIVDIGSTISGSVIVAAVTHLAHEFGLTVTAEGVETRNQRDEINTIGCDDAQGYLFSRPVSAHTIRLLLGDVSARPAG